MGRNIGLGLCFLLGSSSAREHGIVCRIIDPSLRLELVNTFFTLFFLC